MKYFMANWKMNGDRSFWYNLAEQVASQANNFKDSKFVLFPPFVALADVENALFEAPKNLLLGAQDVSEYSQGAYTSQISADMLSSMSCSYVLVGHSECRQYLAQSNQQIANKIKQLHENNLHAVLCVGENLDEYQSGNSVDVILNQLEQALDNNINLNLLTIAYEPVWAIGTGKVATIADISLIVDAIREFLEQKFASKASKIAILYGGSVKAENANEIFSIKHIDGVLVGGASLNAESFLDIARNVI